MENKCPLCNKLNPQGEWVCESCGAELPAKRLQQAPRSTQPAQALPPWRPSHRQQPGSAGGVVVTDQEKRKRDATNIKQLSVIAVGFVLFFFYCMNSAERAKRDRYKDYSPTNTTLTVSTQQPSVQPTVPPTQVRLNPSSPSTPRSSNLSSQSAGAGLAPRVWVNTNTGVYHYPSGRWYANTQEGEFMSEAEAKERGYRASLR